MSKIRWMELKDFDGDDVTYDTIMSIINDHVDIIKAAQADDVWEYTFDTDADWIKLLSAEDQARCDDIISDVKRVKRYAYSEQATSQALALLGQSDEPAKRYPGAYGTDDDLYDAVDWLKAMAKKPDKPVNYWYDRSHFVCHSHIQYSLRGTMYGLARHAQEWQKDTAALNEALDDWRKLEASTHTPGEE